MSSAIIVQGKPLRIKRAKLLQADFPVAETSVFGSVPGVPCKGYGTLRIWLGATTQQVTVRVYTRPEKNVASGSTAYTFTLVSTQVIPAGPTNQPSPVNINADHVNITLEPAVLTDIQFEATLVP